MEALAADTVFSCGVYETADLRVMAQKDILEDVATQEKLHHVAHRVRTDRRYVTSLLQLCEHRNTLLRGKMKAFADSAVTNEYNLVEGCSDLVSTLTKKLRYIYPGDSTKPNGVDGSWPFNRPIFIEMIKKIVFTSTQKKRSIASKFSDRFVSSFHLKPREVEMPEPIVALACAVVRLSLGDWTTGCRPEKGSEFSIAEAVEEYDTVLEYLADVKMKHPKTYHRMMHDIYRAVTGQDSTSTAKAPEQHQKENAAGGLDLLVVDDE